MRFSSLTLTLVAAGASFGLAAPADASSDNTASTDSTQWTCDNGWSSCGVCDIHCFKYSIHVPFTDSMTDRNAMALPARSEELISKSLSLLSL